MRKKELYTFVLEHLRGQWGETDTELNYTTPFELLVAVVLSAQCTDKRINQVTPRLFHDFPTPKPSRPPRPKSSTTI